MRVEDIFISGIKNRCEQDRLSLYGWVVWAGGGILTVTIEFEVCLRYFDTLRYFVSKKLPRTSSKKITSDMGDDYMYTQ